MHLAYHLLHYNYHWVTLILFLAFTIRNHLGQYYLDVAASIAKGISPTLLVGWVVAGHMCPHEERDETSMVSTIHFQMSLQYLQPFTSSFQESTMQSAALEMDIEAQMEN
ncbi:uncharacterized protein EV420DRAFT_1481709 [Desarmillaria tabescens]|uniref:Uncharacterized protein n=1 Tax=Armillaria tabescens TaxID=1929756 RepID=A0AA39N0S1_ARMTA|nr:uncharacterized protein EV420DRAFT_1481709 [Desarmillaria tabescens]KAK0453976.1 hypothetical protein EV420DRAFT_1481709 [Desarmillaria tabescens]